MRRWGPWAALTLLLPTLLGLAGTARASLDFRSWLEGLRQEAEHRGISRPTLALALRDLAPLPRVLELDRRQAEVTLGFGDYLQRLLAPERVARGREHLAAQRMLLREVAARYGVPARILVALWGLESDYGTRTGEFPVIAALATLAWDGRRAALFRAELLTALELLDAGQVTLDDLRGSWAGAMGQSQFLPSSYRRYAVDHDGDGRADIWRSLPDVFASMAHYLARAGWRADRWWGYVVRRAGGFPAGRGPRSLRAWRASGLRLADGQPLPSGTGTGRLLEPAGPGGPAFLVLENFQALLRWNRSVFFGLTAGLLADALGAD